MYPPDPLSQIMPALVGIEQAILDGVDDGSGFHGVAVDPPPDNIHDGDLPLIVNIVESADIQTRAWELVEVKYHITIIHFFAATSQGRSVGELNKRTRQYITPFVIEFAKHIQMDQLVDRNVAPVAWELLGNVKTVVTSWGDAQYVSNRWSLLVSTQLVMDTNA